MVYRLIDNDPRFPDPALVPEEMRQADGLFAVGGDLGLPRLVEAYSMGIFPWSDFRQGELLWYCPMRRFVIFPAEVHVSHSMRALINKGAYSATIDEDFAAVIGHCSRLRIDEPGAWLGPDMVRAYADLHEAGFAHSVEVWNSRGELAGGLYGVNIGRAFMGESMFSLEPSASKLALIHLCRVLGELGGAFVDCQLETPHLRSMGACYIPYDEYIRLMYDEPDQP